MRRIARKFQHALAGLYFTLLHDRGIQILLACAIIGLGGLYYFFGPFSDLGNFVLITSFFLVLITELQNSSTEAALDALHPEHHEGIGRSKDIAAASVLCAAAFSLVCAYFVATGKI